MPRYWELAVATGGAVRSRIEHLVLDPLGPLHREPDRLLIEEIPSALEVRPILDAIGAGAHRVSEIAGRVGRPATSMSRPLDRLVGMGLVRRVVPFGESEKKSRKAIYQIDDPFVAPHSALVRATGARRERCDELTEEGMAYCEGLVQRLVKSTPPGPTPVSSTSSEWFCGGLHDRDRSQTKEAVRLSEPTRRRSGVGVTR